MFIYMVLDFDNCEVFFVSYYVVGVEIFKLVDGFQVIWLGYVFVIFDECDFFYIGQVIVYFFEQVFEVLLVMYFKVLQFVLDNLV